MTWQAEVDEIERRRELRLRMGGPQNVDRQHANGKLTVRERIDLLADPGTFEEFAAFTGRGEYDGAELVDFVPRALVEGTCLVDSRKVVLSAGDFTVRGGSGGGSHGDIGR